MRDQVRFGAEQRYFPSSTGQVNTWGETEFRKSRRSWKFGSNGVTSLTHRAQTYEAERANPIGKWIGKTCYAHIKSWEWLPEAFKNRGSRACEIAGFTLGDPWNILKINLSERRASLLYYSDFWSDPFPPLCIACTVDLQAKTTRKRNYDKSFNPPILHRKELLLPPDEPHRNKFAHLTEVLENLGVYRDSFQIGFRKQWAARLSEAGLRIENYRVIQLPSATESGDRNPW